jgi:hypothetical protein
MDMATLNSLKWTLRQKAAAAASSSPMKSLSDAQYSAGFDILKQGSGWTTYQDFIIPQLSQLLEPLFNSRVHISVLEIGPGPKSVLGHLPAQLRYKIRRYAASEPNSLFASKLGEWLHPASKTELPLPFLESPPDIYRTPFLLDNNTDGTRVSDGDEEFDVILFCHSIYGMKPKRKFIERALEKWYNGR